MDRAIQRYLTPPPTLLRAGLLTEPDNKLSLSITELGQQTLEQHLSAVDQAIGRLNVRRMQTRHIGGVKSQGN